MKVVNKFLRSIEKDKKRIKESSEEDSHIESFQNDFKEISTSTSTPSSDFNQDFLTLQNDVKKSSTFQNELNYTYSEGEILSLGEVKLPISDSEGNSTVES